MVYLRGFMLTAGPEMFEGVCPPWKAGPASAIPSSFIDRASIVYRLSARLHPLPTVLAVERTP
jgi:hypothetical protein